MRSTGVSLRAALRQDDNANRRAAPNLPPILWRFGRDAEELDVFQRTRISGGPSGGRGGVSGGAAAGGVPAPQAPAEVLGRRADQLAADRVAADRAGVVAVADRAAAEVPAG